jgi:HD-GYP domain-containing protein (c-di-GMP phosphodiesterase class II)
MSASGTPTGERNAGSGPLTMQAIPATLLLPGTEGHFEIYLLRNGEYVLYTSRGERFTAAHRDRLVEQNVVQVYVPLRHKADLENYLRLNLGRVLHDQAIPARDRAQAWQSVAESVTRALFEEQLPPAVASKRLDRMLHILDDSRDFFDNPGTLRELALLVAKGHDLLHHSLGTMVFSTCVLQSFEHDRALVNSCAIGALLHDVGKTRLPGAIFEVAEKDLIDRERRLLESHPGLGTALTASLNLNAVSVHCVLFHHEREDGAGFPSHLPGGVLPEHAKVVALCNRYDGLTRAKPYRGARSPFESLKAIKDDAGSVEPNLFRRLVQILSDAKLA